MHITVLLLLQKARMGAEVKRIRMLQDEIGPLMQDVLSKHLVRNIRKSFYRIRRVSEYDVELLPAYVQELEHIMPDDSKIVQ